MGQNQLWTTQFLELTNRKQMLTSGGLGTMGYGFPAAIGVKLGNPDKDVIAICGDGGFQMNIQEMFFHKRYSSTCLRYRKSCSVTCNTPSACCPEYTPDFIRLAESYGAKAIRVQRFEEIEGRQCCD